MLFRSNTMKKLLALALILLPIICRSDPITIQFEAVCDDTKVIVKKLIGVFKEMPLATGDASDGAESVMSLWLNPETDSWTIIATKENLSCVIGFGKNFKTVELPRTSKRISNKSVPNM